jgi:hypothetical protein
MVPSELCSTARRRYRLLSLRGLLALEMGLHGAGSVLAGLTLAVVSYSLLGGGLLWQALLATAPRPMALLLGLFFLGVALNVTTLLVLALSLLRRQPAWRTAPGEEPDTMTGIRSGRRELLQLAWLLLLPLALPILAFSQALQALVRLTAVDR